MSATAPVSALVIAQNEETNIAECLATLRWAEEVVVVDGGSKDATVDLAREAGARVLAHPFESPARQRNWALPQLRSDWVLVVDADERVTTELAEEIAGTLAGQPGETGFWLKRRSYFLGRPMRYGGWQRDWVLRLFRRGEGNYDDRRVHETVILAGPTRRLGGVLLHHTYPSLDDYLVKSRRYASWGAHELFHQGRRPSLNDLLFRPPARFLKMYLWQGGWRDGREGLLLAALTAGGVFHKYAELWRLWEGEKSDIPDR